MGVEGSTRRWEATPRSTAEAIGRHDAILRKAITTNHGNVFKTVGDAFCASFARTSDAVAAAIDAQLALFAAPWPPPGPIKVRMAIHAGAADDERDQDFFGRPVNRAARLLQLAYGGQVLLSEAARGLLRNETILEGVSARDRGEHRLKDLDQPEHVYQLLATGLPDDPRPLRNEGHHQGDASVWNVPHEHSIRFVGRDLELVNLEQAFASGQPAAFVQAIHGLGGIGKTRLAIEFAYRREEEYDIVWWVRAEEMSTLAGDYAALATALGLPEAVLTDQTQIVSSVRRRLAKPEGLRWLLVFDNAPNSEAVRPHLPHGGGHVLITSRNPVWLHVAETLPLGPLLREDSSLFLIERTGRYNEVDTAKQLVEALGDLPLALEQAGAYVEVSGLSLAGYLERFRKHREELLRRNKPDDYPATVATTWELSFQAAAEQALASASLMNLLAFLAPDSIPRDLLVPHADVLPEPLDTVMADQVAFDDSVAVLRQYSLVEAVDETLSTHPLVLYVVRDRLTSDQRKLWASAAVRLLIAAAPEGGSNPSLWPIWDRLLPHVLAATRHADDLGELNLPISILRVRAALYLWSRARLSEAEPLLEAKPLLEAALLSAKAELGPNHPEVATVLHHLSRVLFSLGDFQRALQLLERALAIDKATYGKDHEEIASNLALMGQVLRQMNKLSEAQDLFERTLAIRRNIHKGDHPKVAICLNDLGNVLRDQGDAESARGHHEEALRIHEAADEPDLREIATVLDNLGQDLLRLRELVPARKRLDRALTIRKQMYGPDHPMTAITIGNIGRVLHLEGKLDASREWLQQALEIDESAHGRDHPDVATDLNRLGEVQLAQGDLPGARDSLIRSLAIRQRTPSSFGEGINFFLLSLVAKEMGRVEAGLRLLATQYVVDTLIAHPSAEAKDLPHLRAMAATLGYDEAWLQALLSEVDAAYNQDRGQGLVAEAFPEIDDE